MSEKLYRKKALSKINSPEDLNEIICVTNPGVWLILTALLVLLLGALCWGIFGEIETTMPVDLIADVHGTFSITMSINEVMDRGIQEGMPVRVGVQKGNVTAVHLVEETNTVKIETNFSNPYCVQMSGELVTGYLHPIEFLLN